MSEYLTTSQAAERTGIPISKVRIWCRDQKRKGVDGVHKDESGNWQISIEAVEALAASQESNSTQPQTSTSTSNLVEPTELYPPVWWQRITNHWLILIISVLATILLFIFASISGLADFNPAWNQIRQVGKQFGFFREFKEREENQVLIVIFKFHVTEGNRDTDIQNEIRSAIEQAADELKFSKLRVEVETTTLEADARIAAERLGHLYDATMVIWGADTGVRVTVNYLNLREPSFAAAAVQIIQKEWTQIANPDEYARFVTDDLPSQITFLTLFAVGQSYYVEEEYANAITTIERGVSGLNPETPLIEGLPEAYFHLGWLYQVPSNNHDLQKAIAYYTQAITLDLKDASAYNNRGIIYGQQGEYGLAFEDFTQAITLDPKDSSAYNNRGIIYGQQGKYELALADYTQAITLNPKYVSAYVNRGNLYNKQGKYELAIADYTQAITLDPKDVSVYKDRGRCYYMQGKYELAIADYTQAITLDPKDVFAYVNRGTMYSQQGKYELALADYIQAITLDPKDASAYAHRGNLYNKQGKYELALADYIQAITLNPKDASVYNNRGTMYSQQGKYELAIADYTQAITLDPKDVSVYVSRGATYDQQGKYELALADYTQAITLNPRDASAYYNRADSYYIQGEYELAIKDYKKALEIGGLPDFAQQDAKQKLRELE